MATPEAKHCILAAFTAGFIAVAVVTIVFVVLSPAHISFSVASAGSHDIQSHGLPAVQLDLTIVANNTSQRAAVLYRSIFVDVSNDNNTGRRPQWENSERATLSADLPLEQPSLDVTEIYASLTLYKAFRTTKEFVGNKTSRPSFSVMVTAVARFKVGVAWTRLYDIKVTCRNVGFFANTSSTAACHAAY